MRIFLIRRRSRLDPATTSATSPARCSTSCAAWSSPSATPTASSGSTKADTRSSSSATIRKSGDLVAGPSRSIGAFARRKESQWPCPVFWHCLALAAPADTSALTGRVLDPAGRPVPGATVMVDGPWASARQPPTPKAASVRWPGGGALPRTRRGPGICRSRPDDPNRRRTGAAGPASPRRAVLRGSRRRGRACAQAPLRIAGFDLGGGRRR